MTTAQTSLHILLAEDNDFNQDLVVEILTDAGHLVTATNNGQELLEALLSKHENHYQLILMDLEMPVMDGHQATMSIRGNPQFDHIPIIAMTAHTTDNTKIQCTNEGMQDYLCKPFTPNALFNVLKQWAGHTTFPTMETNTVTTPAMVSHDSGHVFTSEVTPFDRFNFQYINKNLGLQLAGNRPELYLQLLQRFRASQDANVTYLRHITEQDLHSAEFLRVIHTLKGVSATIGGSRLADYLSEFETYLAKANNPASLMASAKEYLIPISELLIQTTDEIDNFLTTIQSDAQIDYLSSQSKTRSTSPLDSLIDSLLNLLKAASTDAIDLFHEHHDDLALAIDPKHFQELTQAFDLYDFDRAIEQLHVVQAQVQDKSRKNTTTKI